MDWDGLWFNVATLIAGVFILDYGADKFIDHTVVVGRRLGISQTVIALMTAGAEWEEVCNSLQSDSLSIVANPPISSP
jgi:Ca2+/Na+ antiporter